MKQTPRETAPKQPQQLQMMFVIWRDLIYCWFVPARRYTMSVVPPASQRLNGSRSLGTEAIFDFSYAGWAKKVRPQTKWPSLCQILTDLKFFFTWRFTGDFLVVKSLLKIHYTACGGFSHYLVKHWCQQNKPLMIMGVVNNRIMYERFIAESVSDFF